MSGVLIRPKVLVAAETETLARQVLAEIKAEMTDIDWESLDLGQADDPPRMHAARRGRRILLTLCIILVPVGLAVFALGADRHDTTLQAIGGAVMLSAVVIGGSLMFLAGKKVDPDD
jgi:hypothetical protein